MEKIHRVQHDKFGLGTVEFEKPDTYLIRFEHGFEECLKSELKDVSDLLSDIHAQRACDSNQVVLKTLAMVLRSVNESWSVFSKSNITLLPHQLWVCHRILRQWPTNQLIADDVGLGKTIEAGLILWPLLEKKRVKRLLILTPAPLVEQWHQRLLEMFDIRVSVYSSDVDTSRVDYWNTHDKVVASLPTLRKNKDGRLERMLNAEPWDLVIIDEAHHLNSLEDSGGTLGYRFVQKLIEHNKFTSKLFFTATPHRGKDYGFFALLELLRPDLFNVKEMSEEEMRPHVRDVLIRNNKQSVTDMNGEKLFKPLKVYSQTYSYSEQEQRFYDLLTKFIVSGQAYASSLSSRDQRAVMLVLIAMQKLASSSIAAIQRALLGRIEKYKISQNRLKQIETEQDSIQQKLVELEENYDSPELADQMAQLEAEFVDTSIQVQLMADELPRLKELLAACDEVVEETRIKTIIDTLESDFKDRTVVFFTEYKATQALLMGALQNKYGDECVTFINGENKLFGVVGKNGNKQDYQIDRYTAADKFKKGEVRFIISTEAGGEGIDLQDNCHSMIHVDLPWNPMRLHQRVGRLNRYGQTEQVEVITLRNPHTVESRIWDLLNEKISRIMMSVGGAMDEPENLMELILGMTDSKIFNELFAKATLKTSNEGLSQWFDAKTKTFGGESVVEKVKDLVGRAERFDYQDLEDVPRLDLNDMQSFFIEMLSHNQRRCKVDNTGLSFKTPSIWLTDFATKRAYSNLYFDRSAAKQSTDADIVGFGHPLFTKAIDQALTFEGSYNFTNAIDEDVIVYLVRDSLTGTDITVKTSVLGIKVNSDKQCSLMKDEELIGYLNQLLQHKSNLDLIEERSDLVEVVERSKQFLESNVNLLGLPFSIPHIEPISAFYTTATE